MDYLVITDPGYLYKYDYSLLDWDEEHFVIEINDKKGGLMYLVIGIPDDPDGCVWKAEGQVISIHSRNIEKCNINIESTMVGIATFNEIAIEHGWALDHDSFLIHTIKTPDSNLGKATKFYMMDYDNGNMEFWFDKAHEIMCDGEATTEVLEEQIILDSELEGSRTASIPEKEATKLLRSTFGLKNITLTSAVFTRDSNYLVCGSADKFIKIWDVNSMKYVNTIKGHDHTISAVGVSPNKKYIVSAARTHDKYENLIKVWDFNTGELIRTLDGHSKKILSLDISSNNKLIASGSKDDTFKIWDLETGELLHIEELGNTVTAVRFTLDSKYLSIGVFGHAFGIWALEKEKFITGSGGYGHEVALLTTPDYIIVAIGRVKIKVYFLKHRGRVWHLKQDTPSQAPIISIAISPQGDFIIGGTSNGKIIIWNFDSREVVRVIDTHDRVEIMYLAVSSNEENLITIDKYGNGKIWNFELIKNTWMEEESH